MNAIFSAGFNSPCHWAMPSASATGRTASARSPDRMCRSSPSAAQRLHHLDRVGPQLLADRDGRRAAAIDKIDDASAPGSRMRLAGLAATPQNSALPSRASTPPIMARTPCPGSSVAPSYGIWLAPSRASATASGCRLDSASRAAICSSSGSIAAALTTRGSGSVSVPVLSKMTVSASPSRSMASPAFRMTPARNKRARRHHLHGRDRQRQRAGTGDDEHGDRRHHRVVQRGAGQPASRRSVSAAVACTIGA